MSIEIQAENSSATPTLHTIPPSATPPPVVPQKKKPRTRLKIKPEPTSIDDDLIQDLMKPESIKGFAWSLVAHATLLLVLAFWYFAPTLNPVKAFDTSIGKEAGSEFGNPDSEQITGGLGMDDPIALPEGPVETLTTPTPATTITSLPASDLKPTISASDRPRNPAGTASGVTLTGSGQAGNGDGFGVAKFGHGGEQINGVDVKVGDPQWTLIWDSRADIDLHVIEPGGSEIYWEERQGTQGGDLDVDDVDGFGPENINYQQGLGPPGNYHWFVHYYGGLGGVSQPTRWKVRVKHAGQIKVFEGKFNAIGQKSINYVLTITPKDAANNTPTEPTKTPGGGEITASTSLRNAAPTPEVLRAPRVGPRTFEPPGFGFAVTMPSDPRSTRKDFETSVGPVVGQVFSVVQPEGALNVTAIDFPASAAAKIDPDVLVREMARLFCEDAKGKIQQITTSVTGNRRMGELSMTLPDSIVAGGGIGKGKLVLEKSHLLYTSVVGTQGFVDSGSARQFLDSFKSSSH